MNALIEAENDHLKYHLHLLGLKVIDLSSEIDRWERRYQEEVKLRLPLEREIRVLKANAWSFDIELQIARRKLSKRKTSKKGRRDGLGSRLETVVEESHDEDASDRQRTPSPARPSAQVARNGAAPAGETRVRSPSPLLLPALARPRGFAVSSTRDDPDEMGGELPNAHDVGQEHVDELMRLPSPSLDAADGSASDPAAADNDHQRMTDELVDAESHQAATAMQSLSMPRIVLNPPSSPIAEQPHPACSPNLAGTPSTGTPARASSTALESSPRSPVPSSPGPGSQSPDHQQGAGAGTLMPHITAAQEAFFASSRDAQEEFEALDALDALPCVRHFLVEGGCPVGEGCAFKHEGPRDEKALRLAQEIALIFKRRERELPSSAKLPRQTSPASSASAADSASRPTAPKLASIKRAAEPYDRSTWATATTRSHAAASLSLEPSPPPPGPPPAASGSGTGWYLAPPGFHSLLPPPPSAPGTYHHTPSPPFYGLHSGYPPPPFTTFDGRPSASGSGSGHAAPLLPIYNHPQPAPPPPLSSALGNLPPDAYDPPTGGYWVHAPPLANHGWSFDSRRASPGMSRPPTLPPPPSSSRAQDADEAERRQAKRKRLVTG